jgi:bifunctional non-homologous end joining protein LigD
MEHHTKSTNDLSRKFKAIVIFALDIYHLLKETSATGMEIEMERSVSLFQKKGSADKEYHIHLEASGDGFVVNFQNGRRGKPLRGGTKTANPVTLEAANEIFDKLEATKIKGGYTPDTSGVVVAMQKVGDKVHSGFNPMLLKEARYDDVEDDLGDFDQHGKILQEKYDGENRSVIIDGGEIIGVDKKGFIVALPETAVEECRNLNLTGRYVLNGEAMAGDRIVFFDIAQSPDYPEGEAPFERRLSDLYSVLSDANAAILDLAQDNIGTDAESFVSKLRKENAEGFVAKRRDGFYDQSVRGPDQEKYKFVETVSCEVQKQNEGKRSVLMKMYDDLGNGVEVGNVTIPPNADIPEAGAFIEVEYLYAYEGGSIYQPVFKKERKDIDATDCKLSTLKYKREEPVIEADDDGLSM